MAVEITLNGEARRLDGALSVRGLLESLGLDPAKIAVERNLEIVPRSTYGEVALADGDRLEIVHFIGGGNAPVEVPRPAMRSIAASRQAVCAGGQDLSVAPDHRHRQVQILCRQCRGAGGQWRGDRHRGGAAGEPHRSQPAQAGGFHRPEKSHLPAQHRRLLHRRGCGAHLAAGARGGRLVAGQAGSAGREEAALSRHDRDPARHRDAEPRTASR